MFRCDVHLSSYSNYRIGGKARFFFEAHSPDEIIAAVLEAKKLKLPLFIFGGGTNVLIDDCGFPGLVLIPKISTLTRAGKTVKAGAGVEMNDLLAFAARENLSGLEWAGGLPGSVGGAVRGNAGAFGGEIGDTLVRVTSLNIDTNSPCIRVRENRECAFSYRSSIFKEEDGKEIILEAEFSLCFGEAGDIQRRTEEKIAYRMSRHPLEYPNIGSIFKNIPVSSLGSRFVNTRTPVKNDPFPVVPAGFLISEAKLRGISCGGAIISPKHANFIVNALGATSRDVESLIQLIKSKVKKMFSVSLEEEIVRLRG